MTFSESRWLFFVSFTIFITRIPKYKADMRQMRTTYVCENDIMKLSCEKSKVLEIHAADYGWREKSICSKGQQSDTCKLVDKTDTVKARCDKKPRCSITALNSIFGDPCPALNYLNVMYVCVNQEQTLSAPDTTATETVSVKIATTTRTNATTNTTATNKSTITTQSTWMNLSTNANITQPLSTWEPTHNTQMHSGQKDLRTQRQTERSIPVFDPSKTVMLSGSTNTPMTFSGSGFLPWVFVLSSIPVWL
ncbi:rhamnose-binding lectin-like [Montipora foliosa]|uniref:rhamnose-binding lectin-like n=1 Tax=Montipora foliosa TaxID=591990 RepID=UPI0035F1BE7F